MEKWQENVNKKMPMSHTFRETDLSGLSERYRTLGLQSTPPYNQHKYNKIHQNNQQSGRDGKHNAKGRENIQHPSQEAEKLLQEVTMTKEQIQPKVAKMAEMTAKNEQLLRCIARGKTRLERDAAGGN
ncbi:hypothetical protein BsWGS_23640 [Bradybaena similaris]